MKTLFMFPGQGAQHVGMGKTLAENHHPIAYLYQQANDIVGYDLADLCFHGPEDKLNSTEFSQPAIFTTSAACLLALRTGLLADNMEGAGSASDRASPDHLVPSTGGSHRVEDEVDGSKPISLTPDACAGLSLGEYTALYAADALTFTDALTLVQLRGQAMQTAADVSRGSMVSILGLDPDTIQNLCDSVLTDLNDLGGSHRVEDEVDGIKTKINSCHSERGEKSREILIPVNFNCPGQIVLSGTINACKRAAQKAESFGAFRAVPLTVAGAFHSPLMAPAAECLRQALHRTTFYPPSCPVLANVDALPYESAEQIPDKLIRQLTSPVLWQQTIEKLLQDGFERFVEIGPGRVLTGLVKKIARARDRKPAIITLNV